MELNVNNGYSEVTVHGETLSLVQRSAKIALWTSIGVVLAGVERFIPTPFPWIRLGLANGVALLVLYRMGWGSALVVNILRIIALALFLGTWSSPAFLLSLGGGVAAVPAMEAVRVIGRGWIGPIGVSASGAWVHMTVQFLLASVLIVRHEALMLFAGPSLIAAVVSGVVVGWIVVTLLDRLPPDII